MPKGGGKVGGVRGGVLGGVRGGVRGRKGELVGSTFFPKRKKGKT